MADNFTPNAPTTAAAFSFAADQVGNDPTSGKPVLVPRVKVQFGDDGTATDVSAAAPMPVHDPLAATDATLQAVATALGSLATAAVQIVIRDALATLVTQTDGVEGSLSAILAKLTADPATATAQAAELAKLTSIAAQLPASLGAKGAAASLSTVSAQGSHTDRSGSVTTGGTAQVLMAANASRIGYSVQNTSSGDLWISEVGTASAASPSLKLTSGSYFETPPGYGSVGAISVYGATTSQTYTAREW